MGVRWGFPKSSFGLNFNGSGDFFFNLTKVIWWFPLGVNSKLGVFLFFLLRFFSNLLQFAGSSFIIGRHSEFLILHF